MLKPNYNKRPRNEAGQFVKETTGTDESLLAHVYKAPYTTDVAPTDNAEQVLSLLRSVQLQSAVSLGRLITGLTLKLGVSTAFDQADLEVQVQLIDTLLEMQQRYFTGGDEPDLSDDCQDEDCDE